MPLSLLIKAAPILTEDMYGDIQPAAWELLLSVDEHMAAAAGERTHLHTHTQKNKRKRRRCMPANIITNRTGTHIHVCSEHIGAGCISLMLTCLTPFRLLRVLEINCKASLVVYSLGMSENTNTGGSLYHGSMGFSTHIW